MMLSYFIVCYVMFPYLIQSIYLCVCLFIHSFSYISIYDCYEVTCTINSCVRSHALITHCSNPRKTEKDAEVLFQDGRSMMPTGLVSKLTYHPSATKNV